MKKTNKNMKKSETTTVKGMSSQTEAAMNTFADMMIAKIESLSSDYKWEKPWFDRKLVWPTDLSGRKYNGGNTLMLMMLCEQMGYELPVFATFNQLTALNKEGSDKPRVMVKKGEKSFPVMLAAIHVKHNETGEIISYDEYKSLSEAAKRDYKVSSSFAVYRVFNVAQTNLKETRPELWEKIENGCFSTKKRVADEGEAFSLPAVDNMLENQSWICPINLTGTNNCYYSLTRDAITMVPKENFKCGESFVSTLFHEMGHSTTTLFNRINPNVLDDRGAEELKAELTAALVCNHYGISKTLKSDSACYLKSWLASLKESPMFIKTIMHDVRKMSQAIIDKLDEVELVDCPSANEEDNANKAA